MIRIRGTIVAQGGTRGADVVINEATGLIEAVDRLGSGPADYEAPEAALIFPGFADIHVHAREDESGAHSYKEDFRTMSEAAIQGGVVHVADMPNNPVPPSDDIRYRAKEKLTESSLIPVTLYAALGPNTSPLSFPAPYKAFMGKSVGDTFFASREQLEAALERYRGQSVSFHCEDPGILDANKEKATHPLRRPPEAEISAVTTALELIERYELRGKICHASTARSVELIIAAKRRGIPATIEVTPHHLYFDDSAPLQMNPPLRTREDRFTLLEYLRKGDIDYLATDHAPHSVEERERGISGLPHLDTYGAFVSWLIKEKRFLPQEVLRAASANPGTFLSPFLGCGFGKGYGRIEKGYVGSLSVLDPSKSVTIAREMLKTKCGWSPFEGITFPGKVVATIVKGKIHRTG